MAEILGLGVTHFPPLSGPDENMGRILKRALDDPAMPEPLRHPEGWPVPMRQRDAMRQTLDGRLGDLDPMGRPILRVRCA